MTHDYMLGKRRPMNDLMAWNSDLTRMPYRMHSEYLRKMFLYNDLASGRYQVNGRPVVINDIRTPIFAVSTIKDHVAPWKSVYKIHLLSLNILSKGQQITVRVKNRKFSLSPWFGL